jgi:uncharacterized cupin superfamily protein
LAVDHFGGIELRNDVGLGSVKSLDERVVGEEEMFFILEGEGELLFGDQRYPIRRHDVIACPTGGAEVAHQIINTGATDLRYLAISTLTELEACEYPDSGKISIVSGKRGDRGLRKMFRAEADVEYYDREEP